MWAHIEWWRLLTLQDYNTRVVVLGATLLAVAAAVVGTFALLRRRALLGDTLCHAALPGIALAFLVAEWLRWDGKSLLILLSGGALSGLAGMIALLTLRRATILPDDAGLGIVLSSFFGAGIVLLSLVQQLETGHAAGLETFLYGNAATLRSRDAWLIGSVGLTSGIVVWLIFKELKLFCFDPRYAAVTGYSALWLDGVVMALVAVVLLVGLQAVGLILMVALLVIPPASARFWTDDLRHSLWIAAGLGGSSGLIGAVASAAWEQLPTGAAMVLTAGLGFAVSLACGAKRGLIVEGLRGWMQRRRIDEQHLLRDCFEIVEARLQAGHGAPGDGALIDWSELLAKRRWSPGRLSRLLRRLERRGLLLTWGQRGLRLTPIGIRAGAKMTHYHRLWELYLLDQGDVAVHRVDLSVDEIEHVLDPSLTRRLEEAVLGSQDGVEVASPHPLGGSSGSNEPPLIPGGEAVD